MSPVPPGSSEASVILLRAGDSVAVATRRIRRGEPVSVDGESVEAAADIPAGHKVAVRDIPVEAPIIKLGQTIGFASEAIPRGAHVHLHNCRPRPFRREAVREGLATPAAAAPESRSFRGYRRPDGRVGTRNYIAVIGTVNCSASVTRHIAARFGTDVRSSWPGVDGVLAVRHKTGCGLAEAGPDHEQLDRTLAGFATHPNVAACVLVGLGCEIAQPGRLLEAIRIVRPAFGTAPPPRVLTIQETGGTSRTIEAGVRAVEQLLPGAASLRREEVPASSLVLGLQCGGSDGYSGITANPALGAASDRLVRCGGTAVLAETPEIYGAEHLLAARAVSREVAEALLERIRWWEEYTARFGATIDNNPSPGNKEGGITTIYEKSLGAVAKGGTTPLRAVYSYAEPVRAPGLVFMDTPGYDPVSLTGVVAGGATVCAFTTGRGSVYGCVPSPCLKISTTTALFERMPDDMDLDAGGILRGEPVDSVGARIFEAVLEVASGRPTKSELLGLGDEEFAPWSIGPTL